jgi:hypothetical protein
MAMDITYLIVGIVIASVLLFIVRVWWRHSIRKYHEQFERPDVEGKLYHDWRIAYPPGKSSLILGTGIVTIVIGLLFILLQDVLLTQYAYPRPSDRFRIISTGIVILILGFLAVYYGRMLRIYGYEYAVSSEGIYYRIPKGTRSWSSIPWELVKKIHYREKTGYYKVKIIKTDYNEVNIMIPSELWSKVFTTFSTRDVELKEK